ncbi:MAG: hypothetical protein EOP17_15705 [Rhizobiaceae bacterium]|nr:MAG: hypothetical protein EOP17_15705 [Rhizobiaceae bacterium]
MLGTTIVLVTHDMDEAFHLADRIAVMDKGKVVQYGAPVELVRQPATPFVETLIGDTERPFRLLSMQTIGEALEPNQATGEPLSEHMSQREALSKLLWTGQQALPVRASDGRIIGSVSVEGLSKRAAGLA